MLKTLTFLAVALSSTIAFGQGEPATPAEMATPKPAPELTAMIKEMSGVWKWERKITMMGKQLTTRGKTTSTVELDGWVLSSKVDIAKSKDIPTGMRLLGFMSYDPGAKLFTQTLYDSFGGVMTMTSKGWEGDVQHWTGKTKMGEGDVEVKETVTRKGPKELQVVGSAGSGPQAVSWDMIVKR